ncbi:MAG: CoA transferase [Deltaproteobacteria bacterium]|nr:CoA transferase [Deltaproteobacteria bacterium]
MALVLDGIRVLDLSSGIAGPMTTMLLADHGADVTRIERPGDDPLRAQLGQHVWNRGKRSAVLDLKNAADKQSFLALVATADVLLESHAPGVTQRLGIDYETLSAINPRLVYCSITGYGRDNPYSTRPGYDALVAARTGLQWEQRGRFGGSAPHLSGQPPLFPDLEVAPERLQGAPREGPLFPASRFPSLGAAYAATTAISAALRAREVTGRGQWVETSLLQGALAAGVLAFAMAEKLDTPMFMSWVGDSRSPKGLFECKDGRWIHAWPPNPRFILSAGAGDTLNATPDLTVRQDPERIGLGVEEIFVLDHYWEPMAQTVKKFTADEWTAAGAIAQVCIQKVRSPEEALVDPLLMADDVVTELADPELGPIRGAGILYKLERSPGAIRGPAPKKGAHTAEVKSEAARAGSATKAASAVGAAASTRGASKPLAKGPLDGITVLDFGLAVAGPYAGQILSDLGARVIKVNALHDWYWHSSQIAMACNRGKQSIAIDLKKPGSKAVIERLLGSADVVMHNMRYRAAIKLGIDYESLKDRFPRIVYCHTRGFERGPRLELPGNDQTGACLAGVEWEDGGCARGGRPIWSLTNMGDTGNGFLAAIAICQALYEREKTGRGQFCETAIVNAQMFNTSYAAARPDGSRIERPLLDAMQTGFSAGVRLYPTRDEWLCLSLVTDAHWHALAKAMGLPELASGGRYATAAARAGADEDVAKLLEHRFATEPAAALFAKLDAAGVPCEISGENASRELWRTPQLIRDGYVAKYQHRIIGEMGQPGLAFHFSDTPSAVQGPPMMVGEHSREILASLGYSEAEAGALFEAGVVGDETVNPTLAKTGAKPVASPWEKK